ncbi:MAG: cupin domain-containing protein, partial [Bacteroidota bacterium]
SGIIEDYCLGLATPAEADQLVAYCGIHPRLKKVLEETQAKLEMYITQYAISAPTGTLGSIIDKVTQDLTLEQATLSNEQGLATFIPISRHSDYRKWQRLTQDLQPPNEFAIHFHELYRDAECFLSVVWIKDQIPAEVHHELLESILCLEGTCTGELADQTIPLQAGDYWDVPLHTSHELRVTSEEPVKLILMRRMVG